MHGLFRSVVIENDMVVSGVNTTGISGKESYDTALTGTPSSLAGRFQ